MSVSRRALLAAVAASPVAGCARSSRTPAPVRIATGGAGGVYARLGTALTRTLTDEYPDLRATVLVTSASAANLQMIHAGQAEVGFTQADILIGAGLPRPIGLARLYDDCLHLVVRADPTTYSLTDLRGGRISAGAVGSGTLVTATRVLAAAGLRLGADLTNVPLGLAESTRALVAGEIAGLFFSGGLPVDAITTLAARIPIRLLGLSKYLPALRTKYGEVYAGRTIPRSAYHVAPAATISVPNYLVAGTTVDDDTAYAITRTVIGRRDVLADTHPAAERINHLAAIATDPLPLHPGAARYFQEAKR